MSLTVPRPPSSVRRMKIDQKSQRVYTLHSHPNNVFAWRTGNEKMKTATVVFRRHQDAVLMANMIERHVLQNKEWPGVDMFDFQLHNGPEQNILQYISIRPWEFEALKVYCVEAYLDMITMTRLVPTSKGYNMTGELIGLDVPLKYYVKRLDTLIHRVAEE